MDPGSDGPPGRMDPRDGWTSRRMDPGSDGRMDPRDGWTPGSDGPPGSDHNCCGFSRGTSGHDFLRYCGYGKYFRFVSKYMEITLRESSQIFLNIHGSGPRK